jgi:hypothetical protein
MKIWRSAGHPGWLGVLLGEFSAYSYVAIVAIWGGAAMADAMAPHQGREHGVRGTLLLTFGAIGVVNYCFPKYRWLFPFGFLVFLATLMLVALLDPRNTYTDKVGIGFVACLELLFMFSRWRAGGGIA